MIHYTTDETSEQFIEIFTKLICFKYLVVKYMESDVLERIALMIKHIKENQY